MNTTFAAALLATSMALAAAPSIASAAPAASDTISILNTAVSSVPIVGSEDDPAPLAGPTRVQIQFVNRGDEPATEVEFQVDSSEATKTIDDVGTFDKDAVVTHSFYRLLDPNATVSVVGVRYADGSEWSANAEPHFTRRQATSLAPSVPGDSTSYN
jgi:hypothetical protein